NIILSHNGRRLTVTEWARQLGINPRTLGLRIDAGWTADEALTVPVGARKWRGEPGKRLPVRRPTPADRKWRGVSFDGSSWRATIDVDCRRHHLGCFGDPIAAALAYDEAAVRFHGLKAITNFRHGPGHAP